ALSLTGIEVRYGGVLAIEDVSFEIPEGMIVGLIGPNGAGKTTLIDAISGFCAHRGSVTIFHQPLDGKPAFRRARAGLGRTFQGIELWNDLTVDENVMVGAGAEPLPSEDLDDVLALLGLTP